MGSRIRSKPPTGIEKRIRDIHTNAILPENVRRQTEYFYKPHEFNSFVSDAGIIVFSDLWSKNMYSERIYHCPYVKYNYTIRAIVSTIRYISTWMSLHYNLHKHETKKAN